MIQAIGLTSNPHRKLPPTVEDVTFEAPAGQVTALLGSPRSGRTTTLRLLLGLEPGRGIACFRGRPLHWFSHPAREVGALLDEVSGHPSRTVRGQLRMLCAAVGVPRGRADEVLDVVGMAGLAEERLGRLSPGMDRRLSLAGALLGDPHTLVLDEPVHDLTGQEARWMHGLLRAHAVQGGTVLFTTAEAREAARIADRVVVLERGRIIAEQPVREFARTRLRPRVTVRSPYAARLSTLLAKEARAARASVEVTSEDPNRLSVYGSTCAEVGDLAYRHGILLHQLAEESGDVGPGAHGKDVARGRAPQMNRAVRADRRGRAETDGGGRPHVPGGPVDLLAGAERFPDSEGSNPAAPVHHQAAAEPGLSAAIADSDPVPTPKSVGEPTEPRGRHGPPPPCPLPGRALSGESGTSAHDEATLEPPSRETTTAVAEGPGMSGKAVRRRDRPHPPAAAEELSELPPPLTVRPVRHPLRPLSYELRRLTGVATAYLVLGVAVSVSALTALLLARGGHTPQQRVLAAWPLGLPLPPAALGAGLLGALAFGEEFRYPVLAVDRRAVPRRLSLLGAKLAVSAATGLLLALLTLGIDAALLQLVYGPGFTRVPDDWPAVTASWLGLVTGCGWAGVLAAGVFRSATAGIAAVVAVPVLLVPAMEKALEGPSAHSAAGLPGRLRALTLWPFGTERPFVMLVRAVGQPVGLAVLLSLSLLSFAYVLVSLRSRAQ
ncbi:ATP-binding cassette domain-containing protein [Streptomyces physcomitrii]|uniref:ATP-binding cassette domain-containing protein n=1 Tax=Streptomyces physcomitrii TaxID=2724184 RepID=A0ABX1H366_9ACTN|nr:ATP-binding cassette domain-containing protein [Streptomyces physcomitrii]NKI42797.1 ATP-binding cassette domain-containing protein [Streptomyces physcomitrii]